MSNEEAGNAVEPEVAEAAATTQAAVRDKKTELLNSILIVLGFVGIFIAGYLSYAKMQNLLVPCTEGSQGCATVDASEMSMVGGIYVGFLGLAGYIMLTALSIARAFLAGKEWALFTKVGLVVSLLGTTYSFFLSFYSIAMLNAKCWWCISSALTMAGICLCHYLLLARDVPMTRIRKPVLPIAVGFVLAFGLFGFFWSKLKTALQGSIITVNMEHLPVESLLPRDEKISGGGKDAPVILVEFADFNCPACRGSYEAVHKAVEAAGPKLGFAYRNFPIFNQPGHETSLDAALISEYAADQGKYFEWVEAAFDPKNAANMKNVSGLSIIAEQIKLDSGEVHTVMTGTHEKYQTYFDAVNEDMASARSLGSMSTPTFVVIVPETKSVVVVPYTKLAELFQTEPYRTLLQ